MLEHQSMLLVEAPMGEKAKLKLKVRRWLEMDMVEHQSKLPVEAQVGEEEKSQLTP